MVPIAQRAGGKLVDSQETNLDERGQIELRCWGWDAAKDFDRWRMRALLDVLWEKRRRDSRVGVSQCACAGARRCLEHRPCRWCGMRRRDEVVRDLDAI